MVRPDYQSIEDAYAEPARILDALPSSTESRRAAELLDQSRKYAYEARERVKLEPASEASDTGVEMATVWTTCFHHNHLHLHVEGSCNVSP